MLNSLRIYNFYHINEHTKHRRKIGLLYIDFVTYKVSVGFRKDCPPLSLDEIGNVYNTLKIIRAYVKQCKDVLTEEQVNELFDDILPKRKNKKT